MDKYIFLLFLSIFEFIFHSLNNTGFSYFIYYLYIYAWREISVRGSGIELE